MQTKIDHEKFANTVLYLLKRCSPGNRPGLIKLNKLLALVDFTHYRRHLKPVTGLQYVALRMGPAPEEYQEHLDLLVASGVVQCNDVQIYGKSKPKQEFSTTRDANLTVFTASEIRSAERSRRGIWAPHRARSD